jgi:hypothetical protein
MIGAGAALAVTGAILDVVAWTEASRTEAFQDLGEYEAWEEGVYGLALSGDILFYVGIGTAVAGLIWYLVARARPPATLGAVALPEGGLLLTGGGGF